MNCKKLPLIAASIGCFGFVAAPRADAGLSVGIGIGAPVGFGYGYGGGYGYGCARPVYYSPYAYGYSPYGYYQPGYIRVVVRPHYHSRYGHRYYCREAHRGWR